MPGIVPAGYEIRTLQDIRTSLRNRLLVLYPDLVLETEEFLSNLIDIIAEEFDTAWQEDQAAYQAGLVLSTSGVNMDRLFLLNDIYRLVATKTRIPEFVITGTPGVVVPTGFKVSSENLPGYQFETIEEATVGLGGTVNVTMYCTVTGPVSPTVNTVTSIDTSTTGITAVNNPQTALVGTDVESDNEFRVRRLGRIPNSRGGTTDGIFNALSVLNDNEDEETLTYIKVYENATDTTDSRGRPAGVIEAVIKDETTAADTGVTASVVSGSADITTSSTLTSVLVGDTIRIDSNHDSQDYEYFQVIEISGTSVTLNEVYKGTTGSSKAIFTFDGRQAEIAAAIYSSRSAGIGTFGNFNHTVTDVQGNSRLVKFNMPSEVDMYLRIDLQVTSILSSDEVASLKEYIAEWGNSLGVGKNVIVYGYNALTNQLNNSKVIDITYLAVDKGSLPGVHTDANVEISDGELAPAEYSLWDVANITINNSL